MSDADGNKEERPQVPQLEPPVVAESPNLLEPSNISADENVEQLSQVPQLEPVVASYTEPAVTSKDPPTKSGAKNVEEPPEVPAIKPEESSNIVPSKIFVDKNLEELQQIHEIQQRLAEATLTVPLKMSADNVAESTSYMEPSITPVDKHVEKPTELPEIKPVVAESPIIEPPKISDDDNLQDSEEVVTSFMVSTADEKPQVPHIDPFGIANLIESREVAAVENGEEPQLPDMEPHLVYFEDPYALYPCERLRKIDFLLEQNMLELAFTEFIYFYDSLKIKKEDDTYKKYIRLAQIVASIEEVQSSPESFQNITKIYSTVMNHFPKELVCQFLYAMYLLDVREIHYSENHACFALIPEFQHYVNSVRWHILPSGYIRQLNDYRRTRAHQGAFKKALKTIAPNCNVVHLSSNIGFLSIAAANELKTASFYTYETNPQFYKIANDLIQRNKIDNVFVQLIYETCKVFIENCGLIIAEVFDAGFFTTIGMKQLINCLNFYKSICLQPVVIPQRAKVYVNGMSSYKLNKKFRFVGSIPELDLDATIDCIRLVDHELLYPESLDSKKDLRYLTPTVCCLELMLADVEQLEQLYFNEKDIPEVDLLVDRDGCLQFLTCWYQLKLWDGVRAFTSTEPGPNTDNFLYEQIIIPLKHSIVVKVGDVIRVKPFFLEGRIYFDVISPTESCTECIETSQENIKFLNDVNLTKAIIETLKHIGDWAGKVVLDLGTFPVFGLIAAEYGAKVCYTFTNNGSLQLIEAIIKKLKIPPWLFTAIPRSALNSHLESYVRLDYIYSDMVQTRSGCMNRAFWEIPSTTLLRLKPKVIPMKVILKAYVIQSDYLDACNKLDGQSQLDIDVKPAIKDFLTLEQPFEHREYFPHEIMSGTAETDVTEEQINKGMRTKITKYGECNGFMYWFEFQYAEDKIQKYDTMSSYFYKKRAVLFQNFKNVNPNDDVFFHVIKEGMWFKVAAIMDQ